MKKFISPRKLVLTGTLAALLWALQVSSTLQAQFGQKRPAEADKLHLVLLVAGHDQGIGNADIKDIAAVKSAAETAFARDKQRLVIHDLTGINPKTGKVYSATEILGHLRGMKVGKNDNVMVFHSGHGAIGDKNRPEDTHILTVDGGRIARKDIRNILWAKQPRALMILSDCCSAYANPARGFTAGRDTSAASVNVATVRNLLLRPVGIVSITAAEDGKLAIAAFHGENPGQAGSAFTVALLRLWYKQDVTFTSWESMFPELRAETLRASGGACTPARAFQISTTTVAVEPVAPATQPALQPAVQIVPQQRIRN